VMAARAMLRATSLAVAWSERPALLAAVAPPRRSKARAARLKMASATSISIRVKPSCPALLAHDMHASVAGNVDRHALLAAPQYDPGGLGEAGGIEADAGLAAAADFGFGALRPVIMGLHLPGAALAPRHLLAA